MWCAGKCILILSKIVKVPRDAQFRKYSYKFGKRIGLSSNFQLGRDQVSEEYKNRQQICPDHKIFCFV